MVWAIDRRSYDDEQTIKRRSPMRHNFLSASSKMVLLLVAPLLIVGSSTIASAQLGSANHDSRVAAADSSLSYPLVDTGRRTATTTPADRLPASRRSILWAGRRHRARFADAAHRHRRLRRIAARRSAGAESGALGRDAPRSPASSTPRRRFADLVACRRG